jgi:hypothetical protein
MTGPIVILFPALLLPSSGAPVNLAVTTLIIFGSARLLAELFKRMHLPGVAGGILVSRTEVKMPYPQRRALTHGESGMGKLAGYSPSLARMWVSTTSVLQEAAAPFQMARDVSIF